MSTAFFNDPILNSPYEVPTRHHALDKDGQPLEQPAVQGRRPSSLITPIPRSRTERHRASHEQTRMVLGPAKYDPNWIINRVRQHLESWRALRNPADWGVTPATARLLQHWRQHDFQGVRPFFCQLEAVETIIWLTEVARARAGEPTTPAPK